MTTQDKQRALLEELLYGGTDGEVWKRKDAELAGGEWGSVTGSGNPLDAWPVGSVFVGVVDTSPATLLGGGTWVEIGVGRTLIGKDTGDADFDTLEETGGAKTRSISAHSGTAVDEHPIHDHGVGTIAVASHSAHSHQVTSNVSVAAHASHDHDVKTNVAVSDHASHTHDVTSKVSVGDHASHTHTYSQVITHSHATAVTSSAGSHSHAITVRNHSTTSGLGVEGTNSGSSPGGSMPNTGSSGEHTHDVTVGSTTDPAGVTTGTTAGPSATLSHSVTDGTTTSTGPSTTLSHSVTNNTVTTAGPNSPLSHSVTNNTVTSGDPSATLAHIVSGNTSSSNPGAFTHTVTQPANHSDVNVVQPYIVVRFWKRTA